MLSPKNMQREYLAHMTGFRAIAAYLVLIAHSVDENFIYGGSSFFHGYVACLAYLGMSIFFVLSGFVITYTYYDSFVHLSWRQAGRQFAAARFARLYPLYISFLLCEPLTRHLLFQGTLGEWAAFFTLTQTWWNMEMLTFAPAWSISTECFFYLCFALWMLPRPTPRSEAYVRSTTIVVVIGILVILAFLFTNRSHITSFLSPLSRVSEPDVWYWFKYYSPYVRIGEFIAGVCAARMFMVTQGNERSSAPQQLAGILSIGCGLVIIILMTGNAGLFAPHTFLYFLSQNFGYAPFLAYIFYACSRYPNMLTKWCGTRLMQAGGEISYSVYIFQFLVYSIVITPQGVKALSLTTFATSLLKALLCILMTTFIAFCSYRIIELPGRRFLRKWLCKAL